jgi:hypothetical protein
MNFLKKTSTWTNWQLGIFKICLFAMGLIVGSYFHEFVKSYFIILFIIYVIAGIYLFSLWIKMNRQ